LEKKERRKTIGLAFLPSRMIIDWFVVLFASFCVALLLFLYYGGSFCDVRGSIDNKQTPPPKTSMNQKGMEMKEKRKKTDPLSPTLPHSSCPPSPPPRPSIVFMCD
jgi:hypothetical protein